MLVTVSCSIQFCCMDKKQWKFKKIWVDCPFNTLILYLGFVDLDCMIKIDGFRSVSTNCKFPFLSENLEYDQMFC